MSFKKFAAAFTVPLLAASLLYNPAAMAANNMDELDEPLKVTFQTELDSETLKGGEAFTAVLAEDHVYNGIVLPQGTVFHGRVAKFKESKAFLRPGYMSFAIDKAVFPSGVVYSFDAERFSQNLKKIRPQQPGPRRSFWRDNVPMGIVSTGTTVPLRAATNLGGGIIYVIGLGARTAYGVIDETILRLKDDTDRSLQDRTAYGMMRGTGLTTAASFTSKAQDPHIEAGEEGNLYVNEAWLNGLFTASENVNVLMQADPNQQPDDTNQDGTIELTPADQIVPEPQDAP